MKTSILSFCAVASILAATPAAAADVPPDTQPGADLVWLLCTVSNRQVSDNCRFTGGVEAEDQRIKAGSILGYLDAHPFPIPGGPVGADVRTLVRLTVTQRPDERYVITPPQGLFDPPTGNEIRDPDWIASPHDPWAMAFMPAAAVRSNIGGVATAVCKVGAAGALVDCWLEQEEPKGWGFGEAELKVLMHARTKPTDGHGAPVEGRAVAVTLQFKPDGQYQPCLYEGVQMMCKVE